ncbi:hypothetical protein ONS95_011539 [Cadophora gregata]|uniref:uncharacterized protein n=1 Tax=Cadophora gregata TaxID=51156 RepID=UPI0026DD007D|nr:uncharacterized protein ONS95_011539 [Cadophora gregata]KAK0120131.1 hypothetical protein ONS95_011539 [Cadophora gregata]KAK0121160.1 hypothetical protein ONS96_011339 [Cadophora gregata f. sp. sojae]
MAERTPVVKKYRDALENVIGATMEFLARAPPPNSTQDPSLPSNSAQEPSSERVSQPYLELDGGAASIAFTGAAQESYLRGSPKRVVDSNGDVNLASFMDDDGAEKEDFGYMPQAQTSPGAEGRWEGRHGELGQMDAEWMLSLCEGDGFNLQMLNEMMRFEPSLGVYKNIWKSLLKVSANCE